MTGPRKKPYPTPKAPTSQKTQRQSSRSATKPPYQPPITTPPSCAVPQIANALERVVSEWTEAMAARAAGTNTHWVTPSNALSHSTISGVVANPVAMLVKLQMMTLHCATDAKENRSPTMPPSGEPNE